MKKTYPRYWHTESNVKAKAAIDSGMTVGEFKEKYSQPKWCGYPEALSGKMGCWTLVDLRLRKKISPSFCKSCECFNPERTPLKQ